MEFRCSFYISTTGGNYEFDLISKEKNVLSGYSILPKNEADLPAIQKLFDSVHAEESMTVHELSKRLRVLDTVEQVDIKISNLISQHLSPAGFLKKLSQDDQRMLELSRMVRNLSSDADINELCLECLAQNNNNPTLALIELRKAFYRAGAGRLPERISDMLMQQASDKNVDEIRAFGRKKTVDVVDFLKSLPQTANGAIDLTKMKKIGQGGTQDVFALKDEPSPFVIKVNRASLKMKNNERLEKYKTDNAAYQMLRNSFGDHCTVEQLLLRDVADDSSTKKAIISVADFEDGFQNESKMGLQSEDFEWNEVTVAKHIGAYDDMLKSVFFFENAPPFDLKTLEAMNPKVAKIANLINQEDDFKDALKEFLTKFKEYFNKTGQYLDIAGRDNIIFFKNDDGLWTFKLGTVIKEETAKKFESILNWLHNGSKETEEPKNHMSILRYCFHWTKALNTLAMMVGMDRVITNANVVAMWSDLEKAEITGKPSDPQRLLNILQAVETHPADKLLEGFKALNVNPEKEADSLLAIFSESPPDKKMALAQYLHQVLPRAPNGTKVNDPEAYKFCFVRYHIAMGIGKIPEGKALALECYDEVLKDPQGPREEVLKAIKELA